MPTLSLIILIVVLVGLVGMWAYLLAEQLRSAKVVQRQDRLR